VSDSFQHHNLLFVVDTSGADAGIVLAGPHGVEASLLPQRDGGFARTEDLASQASALFARCGRVPGDIDVVAAVVGPGSYTGLRSGLAFLRGLAFVDALPAVAVGTLELLAFRTAQPGEAALVVWPAGKGRAMVAAYRCGEAGGDVEEIAAPSAVDAEQAAAIVSANADGCSFVALARPVPAATPAGSTSDAAVAQPVAVSQDGAAADALTEMVEAAAARAALSIRTPKPADFAALARLVAVRQRSGRATPVEMVLPVYVGQAAARPNTHGVAAATLSRRPK
jgi:tRNA threonylcarbamoyladenosine biosynthesis protein TsaB